VQFRGIEKRKEEKLLSLHSILTRKYVIFHLITKVAGTIDKTQAAGSADHCTDGRR